MEKIVENCGKLAILSIFNKKVGLIYEYFVNFLRNFIKNDTSARRSLVPKIFWLNLLKRSKTFYKIFSNSPLY